MQPVLETNSCEQTRNVTGAMLWAERGHSSLLSDPYDEARQLDYVRAGRTGFCRTCGFTALPQCFCIAYAAVANSSNETECDAGYAQQV